MDDTLGSTMSPVTVVIVAYRHEQWIAECLSSVTQQSAPPEQVIVIDDASGDNTPAIARNVAREHPELRWEIIANEDNVGLTRNLNRALERADQPYFAYISADDRMMPPRLERQVAALNKSPKQTVWSYSDAWREDEHRKLLPDLFSQKYKWPQRLNGQIFREIATSNFVPAPSIMVRTQTLKDIGGYDEDLFFEDLDVLLRLCGAGEVVCVPEPLVVFRELPTSLGHSKFKSEDPAFLRALSLILAKHVDSAIEGRDELRRRLWHLSLRQARLGINDDHVRYALRRTWSSSPRPLTGLAHTALAHLRWPR